MTLHRKVGQWQGNVKRVLVKQGRFWQRCIGGRRGSKSRRHSLAVYGVVCDIWWWWWWWWEPLRYYCVDWDSWVRCKTPPVINNKALVAAAFHPGQESVKTGETMPGVPGVMYQVSKLLYLFFFLWFICTDSPAHTVNTMNLTFTQSLHLNFRTNKSFETPSK